MALLLRWIARDRQSRTDRPYPEAAVWEDVASGHRSDVPIRTRRIGEVNSSCPGVERRPPTPYSGKACQHERDGDQTRVWRPPRSPVALLREQALIGTAKQRGGAGSSSGPLAAA